MKKIGRPTKDPKETTVRARISSKDLLRLDFCTKEIGKSKSEIIRLGIKEIYESLKENKKDGN